MTLSARPSLELMGVDRTISINQSLSNVALFSSDNQLHPFPDHDSDGFDAYTRQPSATPFPVVQSADSEEILGSASNTVTVTSPSPSTSRSYRYRVVYDSLHSDWYVCDCESAPFEIMGWVDASEVLRKHLEFRSMM